MVLVKEDISFALEGRLFDCHVCWDDAVAGERPGILIAPTYAGLSAFEVGKAEALAAEGYVGFAIDVYGQGTPRRGPDDYAVAMGELNSDRALLSRRINHALAALKDHPNVAASRTAAIGFCFGGKAVLDLARSGAETRGVVSLHGLFDPPPPDDATTAPIKASILVLHGYDDPMSPPESIVQLGDELKRIAPVWEIVAYGGTVHSFTNPAASAPERGVMFHPLSSRRAWSRMLEFLQEVTG